MGTNYYWRENPCTTCRHSANTIHIGKSSHGWVFSFHAIFDAKSWQDWQILLSSGTGGIFDEYGKEIQFCHFKDMVEGKQNNKKNLIHAAKYPDSGFIDPEGYSFSEGEFS